MRIELIEGGKMPTRATGGSVGYDCYAREVELHDYYVSSGGDVGSRVVYGATIKLGFKVDCNIPHRQHLGFKGGMMDSMVFSQYTMNFGAFLFPRSGWARKYGFRLKNTIGVIDPDYRGEVIAEVEFDECPPELMEFVASSGKMHEDKVAAPRVCQMVFMPCYVGELMRVDKLDDTERGDGGFGHTGA